MTHPRTVLATAWLVACWSVAGCRQENLVKEEPVRTLRAMRVADHEGLSLRKFPGRASATQEVDLAFRVAGPLVALPVNVGDEVEAGDLVARIDPRDFEVALRNAEGNLQRARANEQLAKVEYDRTLRAQEVSPGSVSQSEIDQAREAVEVSKADITALEASVDTAKDALSDTDLVAPFSGTIVATYVENFQNVREKQMIVRLLDKTRVEFQVNIPETLISLVPYVKNIRVVYDAFPDIEVSAEVKEVGAEASETTRTFPVTLIMDQPEEATILPGMAGRSYGEVTPPDEDDQLTIVIPVSAVFAPQAENESYVWVIDETSNTVSLQQVQLGTLSSSGYIVEEGLEPGTLIATAGVHFLKEGQPVRPAIQ